MSRPKYVNDVLETSELRAADMRIMAQPPTRTCVLCDKETKRYLPVCREHHAWYTDYKGEPWFEFLVNYEKERYRNAMRLYRAQFTRKRHKNYQRLPDQLRLFMTMLRLYHVPKSTISYIARTLKQSVVSIEEQQR